MRMIAHRGYWLHPEEKNTPAAFERALAHGYGIETDLRDAHGAVVMAHDLPAGGEMTLDDFLALCARYPQARPLALNIKADGLQALVVDALQRHGITDAFVFDMAVPDALGYLRAGLPAYTRLSEIENPPPFASQADGLWLDAFHGEWYGQEQINAWLATGRPLAIVSPELHKREHRAWWAQLRAWGVHRDSRVSLCTDFPLEAEEFFRE
jgi:hypothetical protein